MVIENFDPNHPARKSFSCSNNEFTVYFQNLISKDVSRFLCAAYVVYDDKREDIIGYFTLSQHAIKNDRLDIRNKGTYETIPATLLGRFAVDKKYEGQKYGTRMMQKVFEKHVSIAKQIGAVLLIIEPLEEAMKFYKSIPLIKEKRIEGGLILIATTSDLVRI